MRIATFVLSTFFGAILGCAPAATPIPLTGLNYTGVGIDLYVVDKTGGGNVSAKGGGGSLVCCILVPDEWKPGMKVTVRWQLAVNDPVWKKRDVEIPRYGVRDLGVFAVHFYKGDVVKVVVTNYAEGHPNYPNPRPKE